MDFPDRIESWLPVLDWPNYEVSDKGAVRSLGRWIVAKPGYRPYWHAERVLRAVPDGPYVSVTLFRPGEKTKFHIHLLVLNAFAGTCPAGHITRHGPAGQRVNWWPENISWGSFSDNNGADRVRDGTQLRGELTYNAKLTAEIVIECRRRFAAGETVTALAAEFGVGKSGMSHAMTGRNWRHIT